MSVDLYNNLDRKDSDNTFHGVCLPKLVSAKMSLSSEKTSSFEELIQHIASFSPTQGWVMYRDCLTISPQLPTRPDILEAEYSNGHNTIAIRFIGNEQYILTMMQVSGTGSDTNTCYSEQPILVRNDLKAKASTAVYRIWYQQDDHRWVPLVQQFVGFQSHSAPTRQGV